VTNWLDLLDIRCTPEIYIGLLASMFFFGWFAFIVTTMWLHIEGRRVTLLIACASHLVILLGMNLTRNYFTTGAFLFLAGFCNGLRLQVHELYFEDFITTPKRESFSLVRTIAENSVILFAALYFKFISKDLLGLLIVGLTL